MKDPLQMTGLEYFEAMVRGDVPHAAMASLIPMRFVAARHGYIKILAHADTRHTNPYGPVHGGYAATVLDSAGACAVQAALEAGVGSTTIDLHVKYLRPLPQDTTLIAEAHVVNLSRRLGIADATLTDEAGKLYATAAVTCMILRD